MGALPWGLVLTGAGLSIGAMLCGVSGLAFAIGVYLPLSTMAPFTWAAVCAHWTNAGVPVAGKPIRESSRPLAWWRGRDWQEWESPPWWPPVSLAAHATRFSQVRPATSVHSWCHCFSATFCAIASLLLSVPRGTRWRSPPG